MKEYNKQNISLAKTLRKNMTPWEKKLWYEFLRTYPLRFQRQKAIEIILRIFIARKRRWLLSWTVAGITLLNRRVWMKSARMS